MVKLAKKILVIEDESKIADLIGKYLILGNYRYLHAASGSEGLNVFFDEDPDLVILDIMLPDLDGLEVCNEIRKSSDVPVIMLTARVDEIDRLLGFARGADDYVCKPFIPRELMARIGAILRRTQTYLQSPHRLIYGPIEVDADQHTVKINGADAHLTLIEFNLLSILLTQPEKAFTRERLLETAHGRRSDKDSRTIDTHMKNLRKKIGALTKDKPYIKSVYGVGYKLH